MYPVGPVPRHVLFTNRWTQRPTLGFVDRSWPWPSRWRRAWRSPPATRRGDRDVVSGGQGGWPWKVARTVKWLMHVDDSATSRCTVKNHKKYRVSLGRGTQVSKEKKVSHLAKWDSMDQKIGCPDRRSPCSLFGLSPQTLQELLSCCWVHRFLLAGAPHA